MSKAFYRDIKLIRVCKFCGTQYRPRRFGAFATLRRCYKCRKLWFKEAYKRWGKEYSKTPARKKSNYEVWKKWVKKNPERFKEIQLASLTRRKKLLGTKSAPLS